MLWQTPGAKPIAIEPHLYDLNEVSGVFPTLSGDIAVRHTRRGDGTIATEVEAPPGKSIAGIGLNRK